MSDTVSIVMATYNGEKYISEQIDSIIQQSYKDWKLYIRDDGSTDATVDIISQYVNKYQDKILFIEDEYVCGSAYKNFMRLLTYVDTDYVMFCDQDDVWKADKVEMSMKAMKEAEGNCKECATLVFTNYEVVDNQLAVKNVNGVGNADTRLSVLLTENCAIGATMLLNRLLIEETVKWDYCEQGMHDWTCMLIAAYIGQIVYVNQPTMYYRQHDNNVVGVNDNCIKYILSRLDLKNTRKRIDTYFIQAKILLEEYKPLNQEMQDIVKVFSEIRNKGKIGRCRQLLKGKYMAGSALKRIGMLLLI